MWLLDRHEEPLEADLAHWYPGEVDPLAGWRHGGPVNWRRLRVLVNGLPPSGTALARAIHGEAGELTATDYLLEGISNTVVDGVWGFYALNREPKTKEPTRPKPLRLPRRDAIDEADDSPPPAGPKLAADPATFQMMMAALAGDSD